MMIKQIMSQPVTVCRVTDTVNHAAKLMWERDCGVIPVVDESGRAVAMLTDRDVCIAAYTQGKPLSQIDVSSAMSKGLYACSPEDSLTVVEQRMQEHQVRRLPVLDAAGRPVGIVSLNDLARVATKQHPAAHGLSDGVSPISTAKTLAAVCTPRSSEISAELT